MHKELCTLLSIVLLLAAPSCGGDKSSKMKEDHHQHESMNDSVETSLDILDAIIEEKDDDDETLTQDFVETNSDSAQDDENKVARIKF